MKINYVLVLIFNYLLLFFNNNIKKQQLSLFLVKNAIVVELNSKFPNIRFLNDFISKFPIFTCKIIFFITF